MAKSSNAYRVSARYETIQVRKAGKRHNLRSIDTRYFDKLANLETHLMTVIEGDFVSIEVAEREKDGSFLILALLRPYRTITPRIGASMFASLVALTALLGNDRVETRVRERFG